MDWKAQAIASFQDNLQKLHRVKLAIAGLEESLAVLAALGFPLHIEEGPPPVEPVEYPKVVFHLRQGTRTVNCEADLKELGDDWYNTLEEAKHAAGVTKQFQRGGVFTKNLPATLPDLPLSNPLQLMETKGQALRRAKKANGAAPPPKYGLPAVVMPGAKNA